MAAMNQAHRYFANTVELAHDRGLIGAVLRKYPEWIWRAADKSAEQDADYRKRHNDATRLPLPDPWRFLLDMRDVPAEDKAIFCAAQSQLLALRHLNRIRMGIATLNSDWQQEAIRAGIEGDTIRSNHAAKNVANGLCQFEAVLETLHDHAIDIPDLLDDAHKWQDRRRRQLVHRGESDGGNKINHWPKYSEFRDQNKLPALLVEWWVRQGVNGAPGFMFWRNQAAAEFLQLLFAQPQAHLPPAEIKKVRQRLGLIPASKNNHLVWNIAIKRSADGKQILEGLQRDGTVVFKGIIPTC